MTDQLQFFLGLALCIFFYWIGKAIYVYAGGREPSPFTQDTEEKE